MHAIMGDTFVPTNVQGIVALEDVAHATQLDGLITVDINRKQATHDVHMYGANPKRLNNLGIWTEVGVVTVEKDTKLGDRETTMTFMGYSDQK